MNWEECKIRQLVKRESWDGNLIESLKKISERKLIMDSFSPLNEETVAAKFVVNYDSLREILEAVALKKGFKIYNHECFSAFLGEFLNMREASVRFDRLRKIRNSINYYGENILVQEGKSLIEEILKLRKEMLKILNEK